MWFSDNWLDQLRAVSPRLVVRQVRAQEWGEVPPALWSEVEVLYTGLVPPPLELMPRLRWVQLDTSGVNHLLASSLWRSNIPLTTLNGVGPPSMAEYTLMMMLSLAHRMPAIVEHQQRHFWPAPAARWQLFMPLELRGATVGILGYGSIGQEIGRLARAFGMRVLALRRGSTRADTFRFAGGAAETAPDTLYQPEQLHQMLAECDYLVLVLPYTAQTHHLIDAAALRAMKPSAFLINVARGGVVDETALEDALRAGQLAGAAIDVFEQEPLPAEHPFWSMKNVILSPHIAGYTPHYYERVLELFSENLRRYLDGRPLLNLVDRERQY